MWLTGSVQIVSEEPVGPSAATILRTARRRAGKTQRRAAEICGVSQSVFSDLERGRRDPSLGTLRRLLDPLGFDVSTVLVRRVGVANQLNGPLGAIVRRHHAGVVAVLTNLGATRVWIVGPVVEGLEDPDFDGLRFHADVPEGSHVAALVALDEVFGLRCTISLDLAYPSGDGDVLPPRPPFVELTAADGWMEAPTTADVAADAGPRSSEDREGLGGVGANIADRR